MDRPTAPASAGAVCLDSLGADASVSKDWLRVPSTVSHSPGAVFEDVDRPLSRSGAGSATARTAPSRRGWLKALGVLGLALPVAGYFWFIHRYAVNMIWNDQWKDIALIQQAHDGTLNLGTLWAQHTANRILFPNLIVLAIAYTTHFNVVIEEYVSAVMLVTATGLVIAAHRRRSPSTLLIAYCPVALLMFTFAGGSTFYDGGNTLWGFQMAWYLVLVALALTLFLLDRHMLGQFALAGAVAAAIVGSFSSIQGLLIWPVGAILLVLRHRSRVQLTVWIASAIATTALFFYHYTSGPGASQPGYLTSEPVTSVKYFLFSIGDNIFGQQLLHAPSREADGALIVGVGVLAVTLWLIATTGFRRDKESAAPLGVALIWFGLLFAVMITASRAWQGFWQTHRYTMFDLLVWVGCYLTLLGQPKRFSSPERGDRSFSTVWRQRERNTGVLLLLFVALVAAQTLFATASGITDAASWSGRQVADADVTANISIVTDALLQKEVGDYPASFIRQMAAYAKAQRLSLFDTPLAAADARSGLSPALQSNIVLPVDGARVTGQQLLVAGVNDTTIDTGLRFEIERADLHEGLMLTAARSRYGWIARWDTTAMPNGWYKIRSIIERSGGRSAAGGYSYALVKNPRGP
jgi:hypothetical protein